MQDVRLRTGTATLLSLVAFLSLTGALATLIWWLIFTENIRLLRKNRLVVPSIILIAVFAAILQLTGGDGASYFCRMMVVIIIGVWLLSEQKSGEFLHLGTWLLGTRAGFELGMLAEMALQNLHLLRADFYRIRDAERMKGVRSDFSGLIATGRVLVHGTLLRAEDTAELLAVRGYTQGGTFVPVFARGPGDCTAVFFAVCAAVIAVIPVRAFFILS